jgi:hypothetical protein
MIPPLRAFARAGILFIVFGVVTSVMSITLYLASPHEIDSASGLTVFHRGGHYVQFPPFVFGIEPLFIIGGLGMIVAALLVSAWLWTPGQPERVRRIRLLRG